MFSGPSTLTFTQRPSLADEVSLADQAGGPPELQLGFEGYFRAGSFKGRIELQVLSTTPEGVGVFAGASPPSGGFELKCMTAVNITRTSRHVAAASHPWCLTCGWVEECFAF